MTDYYPVYAEFKLAKPAMFNAKELADLAIERGFSLLSTMVLAFKNSIEGFYFLTCNITPEYLFKNGSVIMEKPECLPSFLENFSQYKPGLMQMEIHLKDKWNDDDNISMEALVQFIILNQLYRFPISFVSVIDNSMLKDFPVLTEKEFNLKLELVILYERFSAEFELIGKINHIYYTTFKELGEKLKLKQEEYEYYRKKLILAPNCATEEQLNQLFYENLVHSKLNTNSETVNNLNHSKQVNFAEASLSLQRVIERTKILYRAIAKNTSEVQRSNAEMNNIPEELNEIFIEANTIYNEPVTGLTDAFLIYLGMTSLLTKVIVFREIYQMPISDKLQLFDVDKEVFVSKDELRILHKSLETQLVDFKMRHAIDYKKRFILNNEQSAIHQDFLAQQINFIEKLIANIQIEIKEVLKIQSQSK